MEFPYGKAPFAILLMAIVTGALVLVTHAKFSRSRADLVLATHARAHADVYRERLADFEKAHGVRVEIQEVEYNALRPRLQAAMLAGTEVPDLVELPEDLSFFARGPVGDIGFVDLTDWVNQKHLMDRMVANRFSGWTTRGHIFALPHDVHPIMLAYRADIIEGQMGIDVSKIETWDDFVTVAKRVTGGAGSAHHYALELTADGQYFLAMLLAQRGGGLFDTEGKVIFDSTLAVDTVIWYVHQIGGSNPIAFDPGTGAGSGQEMWRSILDGLVLFYFAPDWRTRQIALYAPGVAGKMKLMPLPAWEKGGRHTTSWGATGLAVSKSSRHLDLALELAEYLYVNQTDGGESASKLHIIPPVKEIWKSSVFDRPDPFFSNQPIMRLYTQYAPEVPAIWTTPYSNKAEEKLRESLINAARYFSSHGEVGLRDFVTKELKRNADYIRQQMDRNRLYGEAETKVTSDK